MKGTRSALAPAGKLALHPDDLAQLDFLAEEQGIPRAPLVRALIAHVLEEGDFSWLEEALSDRLQLSHALCSADLHAWQLRARPRTTSRGGPVWFEACTRCPAQRPALEGRAAS